MNVTYATLLPRKIPSRSRFLRPPLAAGYLAAYASTKRSRRDQHDLVDPLELEQLSTTSAIGTRLLVNDPQVIALSVYVWNKHEVSEVTRHVREIKPDT